MMRKGFSLVELLVALSVIAVVAAIVVPRFLNVNDAAKEAVVTATQNELNNTFKNWTALGGQAGKRAKTSDILAVLTSEGPQRRTYSDPEKNVIDYQGSGLSSVGVRVSVPDGVNVTGVPTDNVVMKDKYIYFNQATREFECVTSPQTPAIVERDICWATPRSYVYPMQSYSPVRPNVQLGATAPVQVRTDPEIFSKTIVTELNGPFPRQVIENGRPVTKFTWEKKYDVVFGSYTQADADGFTP